jgi:16S rRNA (uracil1498-N3)-methyltransferase
MKTLTRLFVPDSLAADQPVSLSAAQAHQLLHVQRCRDGDQVQLFNGRDGEWRAQLVLGKREARAIPLVQTRRQHSSPDIQLLFAPIKHARLDFLIEKATELGVGMLQPVLTERTQVGRVNPGKLWETAREAAEQCERLDVPVVAAPQKLSALLDNWPAGRPLFVCAEAGEAIPAAQAFGDHQGPAAILIGPEGGFAPAELDTLRSCPFVRPVGLGPRILRAETAALAALSLWQVRNGDGDKFPRQPL